MMARRLAVPQNQLNLHYTLNGGQAFRWKENEDSSWTGVFAHRVWTLRQKDSFLEYEVLKSNNSLQTEDEESVLKNYLRLEEPLSDLYRKWSKCDSIFAEACQKFEGVRMLWQDPIENIFTFICSSNNNIARIKSMVDKMCKFYGDKIGEVNGISYYDFPSVNKLAEPHVFESLKNAAFGYRAKFIHSAACQIMEFGGSDWVLKLQKLPYQEAKIELIKLTGIGAKVADCICLMSLNHLEAVPVDTHVYQIASKHYLPHLKNVKSVTDRIYNEIGDHFRSLYGNYAGWAHCVLFCSDLKIHRDQDESSKKRLKTRSKENKK